MPTTEENLSDLSKPNFPTDKFRLLRTIGSGAMGTVYEANSISASSEPTFAIKVMHRHLATDTSSVARFMNEALCAKRLVHPNIAAVKEAGQNGAGVPYLILELIDGASLQAHMEAAPNGLPFQNALRILSDCASALQCAHSQGVIHRDLKPANVLLTNSGEVKVVDFGLARALDVNLSLTATGEAVGTPCYMAPEQIRGEKADARADVYSLGVMAFEMVAGRRPFDDQNYQTLATMHLLEPLPEIRDFRQDVPNWFQTFVELCTEKVPSDRFKSMAEVEEELRRQLKKMECSKSDPTTQPQWLSALLGSLARVLSGMPIFNRRNKGD